MEDNLDTISKTLLDDGQAAETPHHKDKSNKGAKKGNVVAHPKAGRKVQENQIPAPPADIQAQFPTSQPEQSKPASAKKGKSHNRIHYSDEQKRRIIVAVEEELAKGSNYVKSVAKANKAVGMNASPISIKNWMIEAGRGQHFTTRGPAKGQPSVAAALKPQASKQVSNETLLLQNEYYRKLLRLHNIEL